MRKLGSASNSAGGWTVWDTEHSGHGANPIELILIMERRHQVRRDRDRAAGHLVRNLLRERSTSLDP